MINNLIIVSSGEYFKSLSPKDLKAIDMPYKDPHSSEAIASQSRRNATFHKKHRAEILERKHKDYPRWYKDNKENILKSVKRYNKEYSKTIPYAISQAKNRAKQRSKDFDLSSDFLESVFRANCVYCDDQTPGINLDRVDNSLGYIEGNVVPCCYKCNMVKGTMDLQTLKQHLIKMLKRL